MTESREKSPGDRTSRASAAVERVSENLAELGRSGPFLFSLVENLPNMVFVKDARDLRFVLFNKAGEELLGYPRDQLIGKNDYDFFPPEQADFFTSKDRAVLGGREIVDIPEEVIRTRSGERILHTRKIPIFGLDGNPEYLLGISEDITEKKRAELERYRSMFLQVPAAVAFCRGPELVYELANPHYFAFIGRADILGRPLRDALPEFGDSAARTLESVYRSGQPFVGYEVPVRHAAVTPNEDLRYFNILVEP